MLSMMQPKDLQQQRSVPSLTVLDVRIGTSTQQEDAQLHSAHLGCEDQRRGSILVLRRNNHQSFHLNSDIDKNLRC